MKLGLPNFGISFAEVDSMKVMRLFSSLLVFGVLFTNSAAAAESTTLCKKSVWEIQIRLALALLRDPNTASEMIEPTLKNVFDSLKVGNGAVPAPVKIAALESFISGLEEPSLRASILKVGADYISAARLEIGNSIGNSQWKIHKRELEDELKSLTNLANTEGLSAREEGTRQNIIRTLRVMELKEQLVNRAN